MHIPAQTHDPIEPRVSLFATDGAVHPETAAFNVELAAMRSNQPPVWTVPPAVTRAGGLLGAPIVLSELAVDRTIAGPGGPLVLRTFLPPTIHGVYLHVHGGGWTIGSVREQDGRLEELARNANLAVISVDYRLAPEHPYPSGPDDCEAAALWLIDHARSEFSTESISIGGESAGATLAAVTILRMRDRHGFRGFQRASLNYGVYDLNGTPSVRLSPDSAPIICNTAMQWFADQYVPVGRRRDPDVSPLYANLEGLPPALFMVGSGDPLLDDSLFMYARWLAAGNEAGLTVVPGATHGFVRFTYPAARQAVEAMTNFLRPR